MIADSSGTPNGSSASCYCLCMCVMVFLCVAYSVLMVLSWSVIVSTRKQDALMVSTSQHRPSVTHRFAVL